MGEKLLAYARLLRLSNGPTAVADVWMGYALIGGSLEPTALLATMTLASLCLYHGGMVLNDALDAPIDALTRPDRPIPSGVVSEATAKRLSYALLALGCLIGIRGLPFVLILVACIVAYNSRYKYSTIGPPLMGACRFFNVYLGVVAFAPSHGAMDELSKTPIEFVDCWGAAIVVGTYILGVTWFAQDEAVSKPRWKLIAACAVCVSSLAWGATWMFRLINVPLTAWAIGWSTAGLFATRGMVAAILQPTPRNIGRGVGIAIQGLVVIDAVLATFYAGPVAGLAILALLPVTMLLSRWIPQT